MNDLTRDLKYLMFAGIKIFDIRRRESVFYGIFLILSSGHLINKMAFVPTLVSQNYPNDPVGET